MSLVRSFRDLKVYQNGLALLIEVFEVTKKFPAEEKYSLTDQIRRSSRSICANISEAWRKRRYKPAFISKFSDAETEGARAYAETERARYNCACRALGIRDGACGCRGAAESFLD